jgi:Ran GTPase-activating protein (RanGAP) involved in mRNA processing and transport
MKSLLSHFLLNLALVSYAIAAPTHGTYLSTAKTNDHDATIAEDSTANSSDIPSPERIPADVWRDNILSRLPLPDVGNALSANKGINSAISSEFKNHSAVTKACGFNAARTLINQQWSGDYKEAVILKVATNDNEKQIRECVLATRHWVETLDFTHTIRLKIVLYNPDATADFLSDMELFKFTKKVRFNIELAVRSSNIAMQKVADALKVNTALQSLDLWSNSIGAEGAIVLADALKENTGLQSLNLGSNSIGAEGAKALADALKVNTALQSLNLWSNSIGAEGTKALADALKVNTGLQSLNLNGNYIGDEGTKALADALKVNTGLQSLNLDSNSVGAEGAEALADALKVKNALQSLNLGSNSIGAEGAIALADALKVNHALHSLNLGYNSVGDEGTKALAGALKVKTALQSLDLSSNSISPEVAKHLANALKENTGLQSLYLWYNSIGAEGKQALQSLNKKGLAIYGI